MAGAAMAEILRQWGSQNPRTPVLDLRPESAFLGRRLDGSCNIPLGELHRRMFWLPPPTSSFAVILPSAVHYHIVTEGAQQQAQPQRPHDVSDNDHPQGELPAAFHGSDMQHAANLVSKSCHRPDGPSSTAAVLDDGSCSRHAQQLSSCSSTPVYIKGCSSMQEFLYTRGWTGVQWYLQDSEELWEAAEQLGLIEAESAAAGSRAAARLRSRFLFRPCGLLEQQVECMERQLAARRCSSSSSNVQSNGEYQDECNAAGLGTAHAAAGATTAAATPAPGIKEVQLVGTEAAAAAGAAAAGAAQGPVECTPPARRRQLRLRCLEPGCGSGRNLAWLAARHVEVHLDDGTVVEVTWEVEGIDFWYGALGRMQELCRVVGFSPSQCTLYHCEIDAVSGLLQPLHQQLPASSSEPQTHFQAPPAGGQLPSSCYDLVLCVRFLSRALNKHVPKLLSPGGYVLYNTFLDMDGVRAFGRPRGEEHLLQPSELSQSYFGLEQGFEVLCDEVEIEQLNGRELSLFLACKR